MTLTKRTIISLTFLMTLMALLMSVILWIYVSFIFRESEVKSARTNMERLCGVIDREVESIDSFCKDYAFWDDTYNFIYKKNQDYILKNYDVPYLKTQSIHYVCIMDMNGRILYSACYSPEDYKKMNFDFKGDSSWEKIFSKGSSSIEKGLVSLGDHILLVSSRPISTSLMDAVPNGRLVLGRFLDKERISNISSMMHFNFDLIPLKEKNISQVEDTVDINSTDIHVYRILKDFAGASIAGLMLHHDRGLKDIAIDTIKAIWFVIFFLTLLVIFALVFVIRRIVINPLHELTESAYLIAENEDFARRLPVIAVEEFCKFSTAFNSLLDVLAGVNQHLEEKVVERTKNLIAANQELNLMKEIFEHSLEGILITDSSVNIINVNPAFTNITGYTKDEVIGKNPQLLKSGFHDKVYFTHMWRTLNTSGHWSGEIWNRHKDGRAYPLFLAISAIKNISGEVIHYVGIFHDMSDIKRQEELIRYQAYHDALTSLPNRVLLKSRIERAISHSTRSGKRFCILFADLDNFKFINDSLGHTSGDLFLRSAASRLKNISRDEDTVARVGGDEFVILLEDVPDEKPAVRVARRIIDSFKEPFDINGTKVYGGITIGISIYPEDGEEADALLKNADIAMYRAKEKGSQRFTLFKPSLHESVERKFRIENELRKAIDDGGFEVFFQPKIDLKSGAIVGVEGLARWFHPQGIISPSDFIPLAEEIGLISEIDRIVLYSALDKISSLNKTLSYNLKLSLNCSAKLLHFRGLPEIISDALLKYDFSPECFELEITENSLMRDLNSSRAMINRLFELGISIALDDFGTGLSSLAQLKNLPISSMKIDGTFIRDIDASPGDEHIVKAIIELSRKIGIESVAEGVEKESQLQFLKNAGCDIAQGFFICKPLPMEELRAFLGLS
ncbi:MAG TPA: EAL domain-containing protein [Spirochaetota bacterium]|nr:EAL domain-containing protein [Spirochaetota bacterium]